MASNNSILDVLLSGTARNMAKEPETAEVKLLRLTKAIGTDVVFKIRALTMTQIKDLAGSDDVDIVLEGVVDPDFRNVDLARHYGVLGPEEDWGHNTSGAEPSQVVLAMLKPGEISDLRLRIEHLSGYREMTSEVVKKN